MEGPTELRNQLGADGLEDRCNVGYDHLQRCHWRPRQAQEIELKVGPVAWLQRTGNLTGTVDTKYGPRRDHQGRRGGGVKRPLPTEAAPDADHHRDWQGDPDGARKDDDPGEGPGGQDVSSASVIAQAVGLPKSSTQEHQVKRLREK